MKNYCVIIRPIFYLQDDDYLEEYLCLQLVINNNNNNKPQFHSHDHHVFNK